MGEILTIFRFFIYTPFYATHLQVRPITTFSRLMGQITRKGVPFLAVVDIVAHLGDQIAPKTPIFGA